MDEELKHYLGSMEARLDARFTEIDARFDAIDARFDAIDARFGGIDARFGGMDARFGEMEARLVAHISEECEKVETRLLTEFHKWGSTSDMRTRQVISDTAIIGERMLNAEDRISTLERDRRKQ